MFQSIEHSTIQRRPYYYNIRKAVDPFIGREIEQNEIMWMHLNKRVIGITGIEGVGKSELARKYIEYYQDTYSSNSILWINCENFTSLLTDFENIGIDNDIPVLFNGIEIGDVLQHFRKLPTLFVFDNVGEGFSLVSSLRYYIRDYSKDVNVIVTSRSSRWFEEDFSVITLQNFNMHETKAMIRENLAYLDIPIDDQACLALAEKTSSNPFYMGKALTYIRYQNISGKRFTILDFIRLLNARQVPSNELISMNKEIVEKNVFANYLLRIFSNLPM